MNSPRSNDATTSAKATDNGIDENDPDTAHWGELLEDAKREAASGEGWDIKRSGEVVVGGVGGSDAAQKRAKKKSSKKKRGLSWNKKATNLWVYVRGERSSD